jgi:HEAT repeat protein
VLGRDGDARVREMAAWALGSIEQREGSAALQHALAQDADDRVRETSAWALAEIEDRNAVGTLDAAARNDRSSRVRGTAAWAIGQLGDGDRNGHASAGLLHVLKDESDDARRKAAWALGEIRDPATVTAIRDALKTEQNSGVRRMLVRALAKSGAGSEEAFTELLSSSDPKVREMAVRGLAGHNAFDPAPWPWPRPRPFP